MKNSLIGLYGLCVLASTLFDPAEVGAQYALGDGRALDSNMQEGASRVNRRAAEPNYQLRNNLVTGNVTGLGYFHDDVGYATSTGFRDPTSSDDLFRFRATSATPHFARHPRTVVGGPAVTVFRSFATLPAAELKESLNHRRGVQPFDATVSGYTVRPHQDTSGLASATNRPLLTRRQPDGRVLQVTASPLLGVRKQLLDPRDGLGLREQRVAGGLSADDGTRSGEQAGTLVRPQGVLDVDRDAANPNVRFGGHLSKPPSTYGDLLWTPSRELGSYLFDDNYESTLDVHTPTLEQRVARIEARMFSPLGSRSVAPGEDVYMDLLAEIKRQQQIASGAIIAEEVVPGVVDDDGGPDLIPSTMSMPALPLEQQIGDVGLLANEPHMKQGSMVEGELSTPMRLVSPTLQQLAKARTQRLKVARITLGLDDNGGTVVDDAESNPFSVKVNQRFEEVTGLDRLKPAAGDVDVVGQTPAEDTSAVPPPLLEGVRSIASLQRLLKTLNYDLPNLKTIAGQRASRVNRLLREAEADLAADRYFDADDKYRMILAGVPSHPMARVGIIHSQLGAGLIRSAAVHLRNLLEDHPEMIALRYEARLLPQVRRLEWVRSQIDKMLEMSKSGDAALMLAYLGYQIGQRDLIEYGLDIAQADARYDPMVNLLRYIWLEDAESADPQAGKDQLGQTVNQIDEASENTSSLDVSK